MKLYNLTLEQNKMVSAIINDLTKPYKAHTNTRQYQSWANEGVEKVRERAKRRGLLLDETDWEIPTKTLRAIVKEENETITK